MNFNLENRVVIITGAASGIGLAATKAFLAEGACVVGGDIEPTALADLNHERLLPVQVNLRQQSAAKKIVQACMQHFGRIDVLFNNAGIVVSQQGFLHVSDHQWLNTLDLNLLGYVRTTREALPYMLKQGSGVLLHTASEAARMPNPLLPEYSVSKAAVAMLSKVLAQEFTKKGIRSNAISPAAIRTAVFDKKGGFGDSLAEKYGVEREAAIKRYVKTAKIPVGRLGKPEEVAALAVYLASDQAQYISGANFTIDGGITPVI